MQAAYTWSKMLDDFSSVGGYGITYPGYTNNNQRRLDKALSSLDQAHHLAVNFQYDLPFKPSHRFLRSVVAGWSLNGITTSRAVSRFRSRRRRTPPDLLMAHSVLTVLAYPAGRRETLSRGSTRS